MAKAMTSNSIKHEQWMWCDTYSGSKAALIAAGLAKPEWFPTSPQSPGGRRRGVKRKFKFPLPHSLKREAKIRGRTSDIELIDRVKGTWELHIPVSDEEEAKRRARHKRLIPATPETQ